MVLLDGVEVAPVVVVAPDDDHDVAHHARRVPRRVVRQPRRRTARAPFQCPAGARLSRGTPLLQWEKGTICVCPGQTPRARMKYSSRQRRRRTCRASPEPTALAARCGNGVGVDVVSDEGVVVATREGVHLSRPHFVVHAAPSTRFKGVPDQRGFSPLLPRGSKSST